MRAATLAILWIFAVPLPATAQPNQRAPRATARQEAEALRLFEQSVDEYRAGRFQQAVDLLRRAYDLHAEPTLLYNLARALEGLGDDEGAIESYGRYLEGAPNATDRGAIEQRVTTLRRQIAERRALAEAARAPRPEPTVETHEPVGEPRESGGRGPWPWIVSGTGLAVLGAGGALAAVAISRESAADDAPAQTEAWSRYEGARDFATAANVCFVAGAIVLAGGVVWVLLSGGGSAAEEPEEDGDAEPEDEEDADFVMSPRGVGLRF